MQGLRETLFVLTVALVVIAIAGDELVRSTRALILPLAGLIAVVIVGRLVWFYTSRW